MTNLYTNSSQLPVDYTEDILMPLIIKKPYKPSIPGTFYTFMGEAIKDWKACRDLVRAVTGNYKVPYITSNLLYLQLSWLLEGEHLNAQNVRPKEQTYACRLLP